MTIRKLKEMIANLPNDMRIYADDSSFLGDDCSEFYTIFVSPRTQKAIFQTAKDFDTIEETKAILDYYFENDLDEQDAWMELSEYGYKPEDFADPEYAKTQMENYGLI